MGRSGRVFRRCNRCARAAEEKAGRSCPRHGCPGEIRWAFVLDVAPEGAKRMRVARTGFATKSEADAVLASLKAEISSKGGYRAPEKVTVGAYLDRWLEARTALIGSELRESTHRENRRHVEQYINPPPRVNSAQASRSNDGQSVGRTTPTRRWSARAESFSPNGG